jgi:hypothetical protein
MSAAGHASAYDGDAQGIGHQDFVKLINAEIRSPDRPLTLPDLNKRRPWATRLSHRPVEHPAKGNDRHHLVEAINRPRP